MPVAAVAAVVGGLGALSPPPAAGQQPAPGSPVTLDGPSAAIARPSGLGISIARDGSGGIVYLKQTGGANHVFLSQLVAGSFQAPVQVDSGLAGASSQPVIAAGNGGLLQIAFINRGSLYVVGRPEQAAGLGAPAVLAGGASNPAISMTNFGKAYIAFTAADGHGSDVRAAYYYNGRWALEGPPLNAVPGDVAGAGSGRAEIAAAGDGVAVAVWGENGHVYSRRVWGTTPSVVYEQADAPPRGCSESSADEPVVATGGDSSFAAVAFRESLTCGGHEQSRVFSNRLHASIYDGITNADGLVGAPTEGAEDPQVAVTEYGQGWVTSERTLSNNVFAQTIDQGTTPAGVAQVNSLPITAPATPVPATAGLFSSLIAWQQQPGSTGATEIRARYAPRNESLGPEMVMSSPAQGPVDAADGLAVAGDVSGEAAVTWLQGAAGGTAVLVDQLYQAPGPFSPTRTFRYARTAQPSFAWTRPHGWGPLTYSLSIDGHSVAQTAANAAAPPAPLPDGRHSWQVFASNPAGQQSHTSLIPVFIDTLAPHLRVKLRGRARVGRPLRADIAYADRAPAGEPRFDASGVARVVIRWGDGTVATLRPGEHVAEHVYRRGGRYRVSVRVTDRAGNVTPVQMHVRARKQMS